jgi:uncharacterized iron-regulated membrane protein
MTHARSIAKDCWLTMCPVKTRTEFGPLSLSIHRWCGLVAALFSLILAGTGCVMAFESEINSFFHPSLLTVIPHGDALSLSEILPRIAAELRPQEHIQICVISGKPTSSYSFTIVGSSRLPRQIFVNQYTGQVLGTMSAVRFVPVMHALHEAGGALGCAAACLILSVLSGVYVWWPLKRIKIRRPVSRTRFYLDIHNSLGFFTSLFLLVFALTGAYMGLDSCTVPATYKITGAMLPQGFPPSTPLERGRPVTPDYALQVARKALSQAIPLWVVLPQDRETSYLVKMKFPEDHSSNGTSVVWVDQYSGKVLTVWDSRNAPLARKIQNLNRVFHTGEILGYSGKTLACVVSFALAVQTITGFALWRRTRSQKTSFEPPSVR